MTPGDIYNWDEDPDRHNPDSLGAEGTAPVADSTTEPGAISTEDLVIEKKWLQLTRIDPEKFEFFFDKYHDRILAYAYWKTGDQDLAADITNTVFARAWQKLGRFQWQSYSFGAWLFQLAWGETANVLRLRKRHREVDYRPDHDQRHSPDCPEQQLEIAGRDDLVRACLAQLDEVRRDIFILHYWVGMTTAQVAVVLKMPEGTVVSHLRRGRQQLLKLMQDSGHMDAVSPGERMAMRRQRAEDADLKVVDDGEGD
jgi:RNA polymerase sigma-70 factor (ECF subfamily)